MDQRIDRDLVFGAGRNFRPSQFQRPVVIPEGPQGGEDEYRIGFQMIIHRGRFPT